MMDGIRFDGADDAKAAKRRSCQQLFVRSRGWSRRSEGGGRVGSREHAAQRRKTDCAWRCYLLAFKTRKPARAVNAQRYHTLQV